MKVRNLETRRFEEAVWDPISLCWAIEPATEGEKDALLQVQQQPSGGTKVHTD